MDDKIYVFEGRYTREIKDGFIKHLKKSACYTEYDFTNVSNEDRARFGGEGKIILNTFARFVVKTIVDAKSCGDKLPVVIEDFLPRINEAVDIAEYIKPLFEVSVMIIYFAEDEKSAKRLRESGLTVEVLDDGELPIRYYRSVVPELLNVNVFYNGRIEENGDENKSGWDPSLFKTKEDCLSYLKSHYGDDFSGPVYVIETVKVGNGWEVIDCERISAD